MQSDLVSFLQVKRTHLQEVISLLQSISSFQPDPRELDRIWQNYERQTNVHSLIACLENGTVIGFGTLLVEFKIRGGTLGHIEDIVIREDVRGHGVGTSLVRKLTDIAQAEGCYKVALNCHEEKVPFYEKSGLQRSGAAMQRLM
jgi:glucosamine-phosphate N-acetyltransferase